ncbi:hypothetical protein BDV23DRAFT_151710 [Aspergillus alliaceus]|uniref:Uncharacterized protein n=1 Tax=Petromyces alliaceus TaxID=209559 RepID=A0A5N6G168_PETAA|nr:uncharacterized protein BDW43DRAFT_309743 [Aspergillus alliaceus]KAB8234910.1 hypothetical protein BDW43DRAFT_309743 [Aspergillus alliaceus]KAE8392167.1 hypothetical protein BDV23DRAFT_151710 [Aspergillus alliaceus]
MRVQSIALLFGLCATALAVPHKPQNERLPWKSWSEFPSATMTYLPTPTPTPTEPPGGDDDDDELPFPWPTGWRPPFSDFPDSGDDDYSKSADAHDASYTSIPGWPDSGDDDDSKSADAHHTGHTSIPGWPDSDGNKLPWDGSKKDKGANV